MRMLAQQKDKTTCSRAVLSAVVTALVVFALIGISQSAAAGNINEPWSDIGVDWFDDPPGETPTPIPAPTPTPEEPVADQPVAPSTPDPDDPDQPAVDAPPTDIPEDTPTEAGDVEDQAATLEETADTPSAADDAGEAEADESRHLTAKEKWRLFVDATQGLATWDLFDDRVTLRAYARFQGDATASKGDDALEEAFGDLGNSLDVRRFSLVATGTIDHHFKYVFSYLFGPDSTLSDAYIEGIHSGLNVFGYNVGDFRVGFFQEPFSLERMTSSYFSGFLERSLPVQTMAPGNNLGYMVHRSIKNQRMTWAVGFFSFGSSSEGNNSSSSLSVTGRITALPLWREDGRHFVHIGLAASSRSPESGETRYRSRPEARFVDFFADTGRLNSSKIYLFGAEAAMVKGPLWMQGEFIYSSVDTNTYGTLGFKGSYIQAGYFLTGEVRPYNRKEGIFRGVVPGSKFEGGIPFRKSNGGAFEVTGRISTIDLNDKDLRGGAVTDFSFGFNWHASATQKVMLNFIRSKAEDVGNANIFLLRYQYRPLNR